jgi:hypothetical protein
MPDWLSCSQRAENEKERFMPREAMACEQLISETPTFRDNKVVSLWTKEIVFSTPPVNWPRCEMSNELDETN